MADLIRAQYNEARLSKRYWDTSDLQGKIEEVVDERIPADVDFGSCDPGDGEKLFSNSGFLIGLVESCRVAAMLADKVVGRRLPGELVEIVQAYICNDEALRITIDVVDGKKATPAGQ